MSRSVHSVKLNPYHSSQLSSLSYTLGDVVFDQDNLTLRVMDGNSYGGNILANQTWTQGYINQVFSQAVVTFGNTTNYSGVGQGTYAVKISGGLLVAKDTNMAGALTVGGTTTLNGTVNATLSTAAQPNITSVGTLQGLTSSSPVSITDNTAATALGTGSLITSGGASIAKDLYVGGKLVITGNELVLANPTFNGTTTISGSSTPSTVLFTINNGAATPVTKFQVDSATGNTTVAGNLTVTGLITGQGTGVAVGSTAPSSPVLGSLWYNSVNGNLYVYYTDANGSRWIQPTANNQQAGYVLPNATSSQLGGVIVPLVGTSGINSVNGTISLATASTTQLGGVKVDGTSITITNGVIKASTYILPVASTSVIGGVKIDGTTITVNAGGQLQHIIPTASTSILGGVTFDGATITTNIYGQLTIPPVTIGSSRLFPGSTITSFTGITGLDGSGTVNLFNSATTVNAFVAATSISMGNASSSLSLLGNFNHSGAIHTIAPTVSGTMDNVVIGSQTPVAATFTSITLAGETITGFTDIYDFDDVSYYVDGFTNNFPLTFNQSAVTLTSPFILTVAIDGAIQPAFDLGYDLVWLSGVLPASKGYTIDLNGNLQFAECPSMGSQIQIRSAVSVSPTPHAKKVYPFKALDIMMGF
jgi:hypothetical protein